MGRARATGGAAGGHDTPRLAPNREQDRADASPIMRGPGGRARLFRRPDAHPARTRRRSMPSASLFWLVALLLAAGSVTAIVWPLLRARAPAAANDDNAATDVYRDQKRQLDDELAAGAITRAERDAQLDELAARLGAELASPVAPVSSGSPRASYIAALILVAAIPAAALVLYATYGNPGALGDRAEPAAHAGMTQEQVVAMVDKL